MVFPEMLHLGPKRSKNSDSQLRHQLIPSFPSLTGQAGGAFESIAIWEMDSHYRYSEY